MDEIAWIETYLHFPLSRRSVGQKVSTRHLAFTSDADLAAKELPLIFYHRFRCVSNVQNSWLFNISQSYACSTKIISKMHAFAELPTVYMLAS